MLGRLILLFTLVPAIELALLIRVGGMIGVIPTISIIVFTGVLGASLARHEGLRVWIEANRSLQTGQVPTDQMIEGMLILLAGVVLLTPGFLTDLTGFALLLPPIRIALRNYLKKRFSNKIQVHGFPEGTGFQHDRGFGQRPEPPQGFDSSRHEKPQSDKPDIEIIPQDIDEDKKQ